MFDKLVEFLISIIDLFRFWVVIDEYEAGILLRLGQYKKNLEPPGFYWKLPFNIDVEKVSNKSVDTASLVNKTTTLNDGQTNLTYGLGASYNIDDIKTFYINAEDAEGSLIDSVLMEASGIIGQFSPQDCITAERREEMENRITIAARRRAKRYGIDLHRVKFMEFIIGTTVYRMVGSPR